MDAAVLKPLTVETLRGALARVKTPNSYAEVQQVINFINFLERAYLLSFDEKGVNRSLVISMKGGGNFKERSSA